MCRSDCADYRQHRQDDGPNEHRRKKPERRTSGDDDTEKPASPTTSKPELPTQSRAFADNPESLEHEVGGGHSVATVCG